MIVYLHYQKKKKKKKKTFNSKAAVKERRDGIKQSANFLPTVDSTVSVEEMRERHARKQELE
jgi:hypothetical protein